MSNKQSFASALLPSLVLACLIWLVFYIELKFRIDLSFLGVLPRDTKGLAGVLLMPFLHGGSAHILSNTLPLIVLGTLLFWFYKDLALKITFFSIVVTGIFVWLFANWNERSSYHIGASGLIYSWAAFLVFSGIIRKNKSLFGITLLVVFLYGTLVWGILPEDIQRSLRIADLQHSISWEGHLFGFLSGTFLAFIYRKHDSQKVVYSWDVNNDDDVDESNPYWMVNENNTETNEATEKPSVDPFTFNYTFIKKENPEEDGKG